MKNILKLEEAAMLILAIYGLSVLGSPWWVYLLILIAPDISFVGYAAGNNVGAVCYNFFHHKGVAIAAFLAGYIFGYQWLEITGLVVFGHSSLDRMLGYGLKLSSGFKYTHLGVIGKKDKS